jgi:histone H3/H4
MSIKEDRAYLKERREVREALKENAIKQAKLDFNNAINQREDIKARHEAMVDNFYQYKSDVKKTLLTEALSNIYKKCITNINSRESNICDSLLGNYIEENTVDKILKNMRLSESGLLITIQEEVNKTSKEITKDATYDNPDSQTIPSKDVEDFWNRIDNSANIDDITDIIRTRVSDAEENFILKNQEDKANVKKILKNTADSISAAKMTGDDEYSDAVEESDTRLAKQKIYNVQHEGRRSVFDRMVRNLSEAVIKDETMRPNYVLSNGRLNVDAVVESARCMYALLEMVSALGIEKVDEQYIEDTLKSIK